MIEKLFTLERFDTRIITIFFLFMFLSDFLIKYIGLFHSSFYFRLSGSIKLIFEVYLFYSIIRQGVDKFIIYLISILLVCFLF